MSIFTELKVDHRYKNRNQCDKQRVVVPRIRNISMQKGMKHALTSTPRAIPTRKLMKQTFGHKPELCRIKKIIENQNPDKYSGKNEIFYSLPQTPETSINGK